MDTTKRRRRSQVQRNRRPAPRRPSRVRHDPERSRDFFREWTEGETKPLAASLGITPSRFYHLRSDERQPVGDCDAMLAAFVRRGYDRRHLERLPIHFSNTIALLTGMSPTQCLVECLEATLEPDARATVARGLLMSAAFKNGGLDGVRDWKLREMKIAAAELVGAARAVGERCALELAARRRRGSVQ